MKFAEQLTALEEKVRLGNTVEVRRHLGELNISRIPREFRLAFANLSRRVGFISFGLRLLTRIIYPSPQKVQHDPPTAGELAEYGVLLHRSGAVREAKEILSRADVKLAPETLLYRSFIYFHEWQFEQALPLLRQYINSDVTDYQRFLGKVNLAAGLVWSEKWAEALELTTQNIEEATKNGYLRLLGNSYELRAQIHIYKRDFAKAEADLQETESILAQSEGLDKSYLIKSRAIFEAIKSKTTEPISKLYTESLERHEDEIARELGRMQLLIQFDESLFNNLVFGTPFQDFRNLLYRQTGKQPQITEYIIGSAQGPIFDLKTGQIQGKDLKEQLKPGEMRHRLVVALLRDLYRPRSIGALFSDLYPGERFDIMTSPARVHQLLHRLRGWIEANELGIKIIEKNGFYYIETPGPISFRMTLAAQNPHPHRILCEQLKQTYSDRLFSAREARAMLKLPRTNFQRLINWAIENGEVERVGQFDQAKYRIKVADSTLAPSA